MADINDKNVNTTEGGATEAPKKKKYATVIRPQNSASGSKPGQRNSSRKPVDRTQAPKKEAPAKAPVKKPVAAAPEKPVQTEAPAPAVETPVAAPAVNEAPAAAPVAAPAEPAPEKPVQRFVNMDEVRAASVKPQRRDKNARPQNRDGQRNGEGRPQNRDGQRPFNRDGQRNGEGRPQNRDGQRPFNRDGQKPFNRDGGFNKDRNAGFDKDKDKDFTPGRPGGQRSGARKPSGGGDMGFGGDMKNSKGTNKKERETREKNKQYGKGVTKEENLRNLNKQKNAEKQKENKPQVVEEVIKTITLPETITLGDLADKMKVKAAELIKKLFLKGEIYTINSDLTYEQAENIAIEYDIICEPEVKVDVIEELLKDTEDAEETLVERPPVVCVMGHVDHGKTSLLDAIRNTNVTDREAGGITQHIGAYMVSINGRQITFLDTPGHEAFTAMRLRGAQATDIAIIVVAADDGVMPQTVEAINHAKAAGVDIIVAVNKIDKPSANIDRVKQEMAEYGLVAEDWGGDTTFVPVSAKAGTGIDELLEMILLDADVKELKSNPNRTARGLVIEAKLDKGKGPVATVLVQKGTLHVGDNIAAGSCYGKVRAMMDDKGRRLESATPSTPVEILGLNDVPNAGEVFVSTPTDKDARHFAETFIAEDRNKMLEKTMQKLTLDSLFTKIQEGNIKELNIIVKADVQGSVEAVRQSLEKLSNEEVVVKVIHGGVGAINESDVTLASASNAIIIGFNVRPDVTAKSIAERENVDVRLYRVIYQAIADVEAAMKGMLDPVFEEKVIGHAEIRQLFKASGVGMIAGSYVMDGIIQRGCSVRISREGEQIFEGKLASLKRFKDDVKEVKEKFECGLVFEGFTDFQELDMVEAYIMVEVPR
ncbi:MAG: translation initiation factor IF-2 [Lachnospiraceae bacterium]|nr:translation initiation factor IF-2 [Lachnospiraceae bacterium]